MDANEFKIAIVYCNSDDAELDGNDATVVPALGAAYIVASLKKENLQVDFYDCPIMGISNKELMDDLKNTKYQAIGISVYVYNYKNAISITKIIKSVYPDTFIWWGGYFATLNYEYALLRCRKIDCCVIGEGEITTLELVLRVKEQKEWKTLRGIAYTDIFEVVKTEKQNLVENIDEINFPERPVIINGTTSLMTSRGCYGDCIFCCIQAYMASCNGKKTRFRSTDNVISEIEYLVKERHITFLQINDDNFLAGSRVHDKWIQEFCDKMKRKQIKVNFFIYARANDIIQQADMLNSLREIGLKQIFVGFESFNSRQLKFYNKCVTVEQNKQAFKILSEKKIPIIMGFMVLEPSVTIEILIENVQVLEELEYYRYISEVNLPISLYPKVIPYYGTRLYDYYEKNNFLKNDEFINIDVKEWYQYLLKWIECIKEYYNKFKSEKYINVEIHKLDMEFWLRSLELVQTNRTEECAKLISQQVKKLKTIQ